jgi:hypothetical protein
MIKLNVKKSLYKPGEAHRAPGLRACMNLEKIEILKVARLSALRTGHFYRPSRRPHGLSAAGSVLGHWKIPMTPSGIEPPAFRLVAQCLSQLRHRAKDG